jgi:transketolase N-terminal domain/subunit
VVAYRRESDEDKRFVCSHGHGHGATYFYVRKEGARGNLETQTGSDRRMASLKASSAWLHWGRDPHAVPQVSGGGCAGIGP